MILSVVFCFALTAFGQETAGSIEVTVKDPQGAVVPNATIRIESSSTDRSSTTGYRRTVTTDSQGFQRILQVPPGTYKVTVEAVSGFAERSVDDVNVVLGKVTPVNVNINVAGASAVVEVGAGESPIDTTDTKIQTNISQAVAELLPKGTNFSSLLKVSPATRPEPLTGGFQVDGASGSENTFIIDGNEVTDAISGTLNQNNNLPFQIVQEVQVKSSGFEAEFGGATGGVINVVTRGGSNDFRGEFGVQFQPGKLSATSRPILFLGNQLEYIQPLREPSLGFFPTASLGGPILKDRLWFFGSYTPQIFTRDRTIPYRTGLAPETYRSKQKNEYAFARLDAQPLSSLRLTGTFTYNPIIQEGELPGVTTQFDTRLPSGNGLTGVDYQRQLGGRQNAKNATGQIVWTPTNNLVLNVRGGHNFLNSKLGTYGREPAFPPTASNTRILCSTGGLTPPPSAGCVRGQSNGIGLFRQASYDATTRNTIDADVTFITNFGGRHEFKGGYQYNGLANELLTADNPYIILRYGRQIDVYSGRPITPTPACGTPGAPTVCSLGSGSIVRYAESGDVSSKNEGFFIQDKWQPIRRLTLNLGVRFERENVPSFTPNGADLVFDFQDKIAPRIGAAYDLTGDGKTKISGFYGWFYDRFKYELPRGSFGGAQYYQEFFEILSNDPAAFQFSFPLIQGSGTVVNTPGGACPATGFIYGRIRCALDFRVPSNAGLDINIAGAIDPDIKPYRQQELTFTFERELTSKFVMSARYTRKKLDRAIEDIGFITPTGSEAYIIGNPGFGLAKQYREAQGFTATKAVRDYDAFEVRLDRRFADDYYFNLNYTYSRLYGNYSGLASTDEEGRTDPNVSRAFDAPFTEALVAGGESLGRLATDRPHVLKFAGAYSLDWNKRFGLGSNNTTEFQTFFTAQSGTPLSTFADIAHYDTVLLNGRGDLGRTEAYTQTDFAVRHRYRFGRDNRFTLVGEVDILNLFNENNELGRYTLISTNSFTLEDPINGLVSNAEARAPFLTNSAGVITCGTGSASGAPCALGTGTLSAPLLSRTAQQRFQRNGAPAIVTQANNASLRDPRYNLTDVFQPGRTVRFGFRLLF